MTRWYYSTNGKAEGPVTPEFLIEQLKLGAFTFVDLVFKEGESAWRTFGEIPEFRAAVQAVPAFVPPPPAKVQILETTVMPLAAGISDDFFGEISIDDLTPVPIHAGSATSREMPYDDSPIFVPESSSVRVFEKPEDGWPSDWRLSSSWVVLRKRADGSGYDQDGPFSAEHIIDMIGSGKIDYSQYCWKPGYTRWFRIGNLPEFDRRKRDRDNDTVNQIVAVPSIDEALPALTREELLSNVERLRQDKRSQEKAPSEASGQNLIETPIDLVKGVVAEASRHDISERVAPFEPPIAEVAWPPKSFVAPVSLSKSKAGSSKAMRFALATFVVVALVAVLMQVAAFKNRQPAAVQTAPIPAPKPPRAGTSRSKTSMSDTSVPGSTLNKVAGESGGGSGLESGFDSGFASGLPSTKAEPPASTSSLEINPKNLETAPVLEFSTDMGAHEKILVKLKAHTGDVLQFGSFSKVYEVTRSMANAGLPILDLSKERLPAGSYFVEASVGSMQTSTQIFIGKKDEQFDAELERHIKSISLRQLSEKSALYYGAQRLEKLSKDVALQSHSLKMRPAKWKPSLAAWRASVREASLPVLILAQSPATDIAYPEMLASFRLSAEHVANQAKDVIAAFTQKREPATSADLTNELVHLREESAKLSGRKSP